MNTPIYQVDAFTERLFSGNSACVVLLKAWIPESKLLKIAKENAVAETAFVVMNGGSYQLRWFTPDIEIDLCGHATLAAGHIVLTHVTPDKNAVQFRTISGQLDVERDDNAYRIALPNRPAFPAELPSSIAESLSLQPQEVLKARDYLLVYASESEIADLQINREVFDRINLDPGGVAVTAAGHDCDFVSRFFTPQATIMEDPVTGSAHCSLTPYWSERLGKKTLEARQISHRRGELRCDLKGDLVHLLGHAVTYSAGHIQIDED